MKLINAILVSALALSLAACSISIEDGGYGNDIYDGRADYVTVTLPSGQKDSFRCPQEMEVFVVDDTEEGRGMVYGCRSRGAATPALNSAGQ